MGRGNQDFGQQHKRDRCLCGTGGRPVRPRASLGRMQKVLPLGTESSGQPGCPRLTAPLRGHPSGTVALSSLGTHPRMSSEAPCVAAKPGNSPNVTEGRGLSVTSSWPAAPRLPQDGRGAWGALGLCTEASWWGPARAPRGLCRLLPPEGLWSGPCPAPLLTSPL